MDEITRVGVDLAKRVIQVHAVNADGRVVVARALARDKFVPWCAQLPTGCLVAMEACSGAHHWARKLQALGLDARLSGSYLGPHRSKGCKKAVCRCAVCLCAMHAESARPPGRKANTVLTKGRKIVA